MQDKATLNPTPDQTFEIVGQGAYDFVRVLTHSKQLQRQGRVEEACNERFHAFQRISELLPWKRTENPYFLVITVLMITGLALSLFGDSLSNPSAFALHYILLGLLFKNINIQDESIIYNRNH